MFKNSSKRHEMSETKPTEKLFLPTYNFSIQQ